MNKNVVVVLIGGFVVAILVAVLVQASLGGSKATQDAAPKSYVLVAAKDLAVGSELIVGDLTWQEWPGQTFSGAIIKDKEQKAEEALTGRLTTRVAQGQPVLSSYIFKAGRGNIVAATMQKGMRAVAIPVNANTMAGGFVSPGDYVDIILTYRVRGNTNTPELRMLVSQHVSETILKNIRILAVDQESSRAEDSAKIAKTVTLEVDSEGAEKISLAVEMGELALSLRGLGDADVENTSSYTTDVQTSRILQNMARIENGGTSGSIKIYNGSTLLEQRPRGVLVESATNNNGNDHSTDDAVSQSKSDEGQNLGSIEESAGEGETE